MTRQYVWKKKDGTFTRPYSKDLTLSAAGVKLQSGAGPFQVSQDGEPVGRLGTRVVTLRRLGRLLETGKPGPVYRVREWEGDVVFVVREVQATYGPSETSGNDKVDAFAGEVYGRFDEFDPRYAGAYVCKPSSQHRFGNAIDFFFNSLVHQDEVASWAVVNADRLHIEHVISRDRIWTRGVGNHPYGGEYHNHIHVDFSPNFPTSWACGVRG